MQIKLLHDLVEEMAGVGTGRIVEILFKKKDVNEFLIAKKMELTINQVRNILYKLSAEGLVSFIRKKDKRKGWYIYYWTLKIEKCLIKLEQSLLNKIDQLKLILENRETQRFYICQPCGIEVNEDKALEHGFTCEECAEVYELSDNNPMIRSTKSKITITEKSLKMIREELKTIREKEKKKRARAEKKEEKEKQAKKDLIKKARALAKAKVKKTAKKKTAKKKTAKKKTVKKAVKKTAKKAVKKKSAKKR
jgi:transcription factor E